MNNVDVSCQINAVDKTGSTPPKTGSGNETVEEGKPVLAMAKEKLIMIIPFLCLYSIP